VPAFPRIWQVGGQVRVVIVKLEIWQ